jgi:hypothetical protein
LPDRHAYLQRSGEIEWLHAFGTVPLQPGNRRIDQWYPRPRLDFDGVLSMMRIPA